MARRVGRTAERRLELPAPAARDGGIRGPLAFCNEAVGLTVDGERQERPVTHFTTDLTEQQRA